MNRLRNLTVILASVALGALPMTAAAQMGPGYYDGHMWGSGWHGWFLGPLMMIFWLAIVVGAVVMVIRWAGLAGPGSRRQVRDGAEALDILRARFARGEIDKAEFEERRALLES